MITIESSSGQNQRRRRFGPFKKANLRFVVSVAKHCKIKLDLPDLINKEILGLIKAAKRFDETRGLNLSLTLFGGFVKGYPARALTEQSRIVQFTIEPGWIIE